MTHVPQRHPHFGLDRDLRETPQLCSLCDAPIGEDEAPLQLFSQGEPCLAWIYCDACEHAVLPLFIPAAKENA